jgi:hypothetical protein
MLNYEFITALLSFTIVMVLFNIIKDFIIIPQFNLSRKTLDNINKRWYISFIIGAIILFLIYGRAGPI